MEVYRHRLSEKEIDEGEMYTCDECNRSFEEAWIVKPSFVGFIRAHSLCYDCLKILRSKIDRLSILVTEGISMSEG